MLNRVPEIRILIGLPRSGKTTYTKDKVHNFTIISADQLRYLVYGQRFWGGGEDLMWAVRGVLLRMLMEQKKDIIVDETNTTIGRRRPIILMAKEYGYRITGIYIKTSSFTCKQRAIDAGDEQLIDIINRMGGQFEPPTTEEGFDIVEEIEC